MIRRIALCLCVSALAATFSPVAAPAAENMKFKLMASEYLDEKGATLKYPEGIACSKKSTIIVADTGNGRLLRYTLQNDTLKAGPEIKLSQVSYPTKVAINSKEEIFVLDGKQHRIARLTPDGAFVGYIDMGTSVMPKSFAIDPTDSIYILDVRRGQVIVTDPAGKQANEIPFPSEYGFISDIAVDGKGNILLLDNVKMMLYVATRETKAFKPMTGSLREYLDFASNIVADSHGKIFISDQNGGAVIILGQDGSFQGRQLNSGRKGGLVYYPAQACVTDSGEFAIADRNNSRIQLFKLIR